MLYRNRWWVVCLGCGVARRRVPRAVPVRYQTTAAPVTFATLEPPWLPACSSPWLLGSWPCWPGPDSPWKPVCWAPCLLARHWAISEADTQSYIFQILYCLLCVIIDISILLQNIFNGINYFIDKCGHVIFYISNKICVWWQYNKCLCHNAAQLEWAVLLDMPI